MATKTSSKSKAYVKLIAKRAVKTFAQTEGALLTAAGTGLLDSDWKTSLSVSGMAALLSVLTTLGGTYVTTSDDDVAPGQD